MFVEVALWPWHILLGCPHVLETVRDEGGGWGEKVRRMAAVSLGEYKCALMHTRFVFFHFFHIGASQTVQSDRRKLCWDNPSAVSLNHTTHTTPLSRRTLRKTYTYKYREADREIWIFEKGLRQKLERPWVWYHKYIVCISHGPVSWSLSVCMCVCNFSLYLSCAHLLSITYFPSPTPFFFPLLSIFLPYSR